MNGLPFFLIKKNKNRFVFVYMD